MKCLVTSNKAILMIISDKIQIKKYLKNMEGVYNFQFMFKKSGISKKNFLNIAQLYFQTL